MKKQIDLSPYSKGVDDTMIRTSFIEDYQLMLMYCTLNNHNPITISELEKTYNKIFSTNFSKSYFFQKLRKIEHFGLFIKKPILECFNAKKKTDLDNLIIAKHNEWLMRDIPKQFREQFTKNIYYVLTEKGEEWVAFVSQQLKKIKEGR